MLPAQTEWGWKVAAYLFLAGVGAGGYATGAVASFGGPEWAPVSRIGVSLGFPSLLLGTLFLVADLGVKNRALGVFLNPATSWIARGSIIITAFLCLSFLHLASFAIPIEPLKEASGALSVAALLFALLVMVYSGVLLAASRAIALWSTAMLPLLFLVSALSCGVMAVLVSTALVAYHDPALLSTPHAFLVRVVAGLVVLEAIVVALYLQGAHRVEESRASAFAILKGKLARTFWVGDVLVGLVLPLLVALYAIAFPPGDSPAGLLWTGLGIGLPGLVGGFLLRNTILKAGIRAPLRAGGIEYSFKPFPGGS